MTLWRRDAPVGRVTASREVHEVRSRLFLRLEEDGVEGFGEIAPQARALNGDAGLDEVLEELTTHTLTQLRAVVAREGAMPHWTRVARFAGSRPASPFAAALVEMAVLDRELRAEGHRLEELWAPAHEARTQRTVSLLDDEPWRVEGAERVRVKTGPGPLRGVALERLEELVVPVLLDFNCSAEGADEVVEQVRVIGERCVLEAVEQPFGPTNLVDHAALAGRLEVPISLDEAVRAPRDVDAIARYGAAAMVCVKPARVGGLATAHSVVRRARERGLRCYLGGFFESDFARGVHRTLAQHCVEEPSDVAPLVRVGGPPEVEQRRDGLGFAPSVAVLESATCLVGA